MNGGPKIGNNSRQKQKRPSLAKTNVRDTTSMGRKHRPAPYGVGFPYPPFLHQLSLIHGGVGDVGPHDKAHPVVDISEDIGSKKCCVLKVKDETMSG